MVLMVLCGLAIVAAASVAVALDRREPPRWDRDGPDCDEER